MEDVCLEPSEFFFWIAKDSIGTVAISAIKSDCNLITDVKVELRPGWKTESDFRIRATCPDRRWRELSHRAATQ